MRSVPFKQSTDDLAPLHSCAGRRRAHVPLESLSLSAPDAASEESLDEVAVAADMLGRLLAYGTQSRTIHVMGKRFWAMCYVLRPDLLEGQTMEDFGAQDNKTRQSIEQYVKEFKMTFGVK